MDLRQIRALPWVVKPRIASVWSRGTREVATRVRCGAAMTTMTATENQIRTPDAAEVRAALERMLASEPFRGSPQLAAFLRFIVEETLAGNADRIKGYAIAVEALGRDASFDPAVDPIVRVEANRLRRAIDTYYAGPGQNDPIVIGLKRGGYVPSFGSRDVAPLAEVKVKPKSLRLRERVDGLLLHPLRLAVFVAVIAAAVSIGLDIAARVIGWVAEPASRSTTVAPQAELRGGPGLPIIHVELFDIDGTPGGTAVGLEPLRSRFQDSLSRFEELEVLTEPTPSGVRSNESRMQRGEYRLTGTLTYTGESTVNLTARLIDAESGALVWNRSFENVREAADRDSINELTLDQVVTALAQPNGIIQARERRRRAAGGAVEARYACVLDTYDYLRTYDRAAHAPARACLEHAIVSDPNFALGYALLGEIYTREYVSDFDAEPENPALDRALRAAQRAVELAPASARAHLALMGAHFARREDGAALQAGERAVQLNPDGMQILADYAYVLIFLGDLEKGAELLHKVAESGAVLMYRTQHALFITAYLAGDVEAATLHANAIGTDSFPLGLTAKALVAAKAGDMRRARQIIERLVTLQPSWGRDPHGELRKVFRDAAMAKRFAADLAAIGLGATN
jgi:Tfp pilus assembly protein PilF